MIRSIKNSEINQRFLAPEVVQTSAMDCGPAALKSILEGFDISVSYGRLREACQTDVDGTSINTVEDIAILLGLNAEQVMLPADHLLLPEAQALPAIVVVQRPNGMTHFLVVWNQVGKYLQVMDPATGRRWVHWKKFKNEIFIHTFAVPCLSWREWAGTDGLLLPLRRRMLDIKIEESLIDRLINQAIENPDWRPIATLDAAVRMTSELVQANGLEAGDQAAAVLERFYRLNLQGPLPKVESGGENANIDQGNLSSTKILMIPAIYWSVLPVIVNESQSRGVEEPDSLYLRGAVLVRITGVREPAEEWSDHEKETRTIQSELPPDLAKALEEPSYRPEHEVWKALKEDGLLTPAILTIALFLSTVGVMIEALLFQGMIQLAQIFSLKSQRVLAALAVVAFVVILFLLELPISSTVLHMGRRLEARLRIAFLEKLPRLGDRYFRSRLASDMTQRAYDLRGLRMLPNLGVQLLRTGFQIFLTAIGVIWLDPISAPLAILGTLFFIGLTILSRPLIEERDLRLRTHTGALSRFYLDALLGLIPIKTHRAEKAMLRQHEAQLFEWVRTGRDYYSISSLIQSFGALLYTGFSILILVNYISRGGEAGEILLLFYWTLNLPALGQSFANLVHQYPLQRNRVLRLLEPLAAPEEEESWNFEEVQKERSQDFSPLSDKFAASVEIQDVRLQAGGHVILDDINLKISPGEHIAIVGVSGAGKSSLVGLMLGWHKPSQGRIFVDGNELDGKKLHQLRRETAWVDPAVQLWNASLYDNIRYGIENIEGMPLGEIIQSADLYEVMERLPNGLKTILGESGGLVSGGEGQRVRLGRAMHRPKIRLAVLDEPFRGLDREKRRNLLAISRQHWKEVTLLCVTHDVGETIGFPRVLVIESGRIIEDGCPVDLAANPTSRYRELLDAEKSIRKSIWANVRWRRFNIDSGKLKIEE